MADAETVLLIDCWADRQAIDRRHAAPMMEKIAELRVKCDLHMKVERYFAEELSEGGEGYALPFSHRIKQRTLYKV